MVYPATSSLPAHSSRQASASSEDEVDELATPPATTIPDVEDSSDEEQDTGSHRDVQQRQSLTADERILARVVRNGVDNDQLKLIKGMTILLRSHKAKNLEAQGLRDLDEYVANEIRAKPSRTPLRQVKETLCVWTKNRGLPVVPIAATTVFLYAHNIFVGQKAIWKRELRMSMLEVLQELRSIANKVYENDFRGIPQYRNAFLDSMLDTPEARALLTVSRDLDTDSDDDDLSQGNDEDALSSGEEVAQNLTASSPGRRSRREKKAAKAIAHSNVPERSESKRTLSVSESISASPRARKRQKNGVEVKEVPAITAQNATAITDVSLAQAIGHRKSPSKASPLSLPAVPLPTVSRGRPIQPTNPSEWSNAPVFDTSKTSDTSSSSRNSRPPPQRLVIDLSLGSSDGEDAAVPAAAKDKQVEVANQDNSHQPRKQAESVDRPKEQADSVDRPKEVGQTNLQRKPRPPLVPRPRRSDFGNSAPPATMLSSNVSRLSSDPPADTAALAAPHSTRAASSGAATSVPQQAVSTSQVAALLFNKAVGAVKDKIAGAVLSAPEAQAGPRQESALPLPSASETSESNLLKSAGPDSTDPESRDAHSTAGRLLAGIESSGPWRTTTTSAESSHSSIEQNERASSAAVLQGNVTILDLTKPSGATRTSVVEASGLSEKSTLPASHSGPDRSWGSLDSQRLGDYHGPLQKETAPAPAPAPAPPPPPTSTPALVTLPTAAESQARSPIRTPPIFDNWDLSFMQLEQAVSKTLAHTDPAITSADIGAARYIKETAPNKQASAFFGWQRNSRRSNRLRLASSTSSTTQSPNNADASVPERRITLAQWHNMSPGQQETIRSAQLHSLKPRYPDFLRNIRTPTVATGLGPVYVGPTKRADSMGHTAEAQTLLPGATGKPSAIASSFSGASQVAAMNDTLPQSFKSATDTAETSPGPTGSAASLSVRVSQVDDQQSRPKHIADLGQASALPAQQAGSEHTVCSTGSSSGEQQASTNSSGAPVPSIAAGLDDNRKQLQQPGPNTDVNRFTEIISPVTTSREITAPGSNTAIIAVEQDGAIAAPAIQMTSSHNEPEKTIPAPAGQESSKTKALQSEVRENSQETSHDLSVSQSNTRVPALQANGAATFPQPQRPIGPSLPMQGAQEQSVSRRSSELHYRGSTIQERRSSQPVSIPQTSPPLADTYQQSGQRLPGVRPPTGRRVSSHAAGTHTTGGMAQISLFQYTSQSPGSGQNSPSTYVGPASFPHAQQPLQQQQVRPHYPVQVQQPRYMDWEASSTVASYGQASSPHGSPQQHMQLSRSHGQAVYGPGSARQQSPQNLVQNQLQGPQQSSYRYIHPYQHTQPQVAFHIQQQQQQETQQQQQQMPTYYPAQTHLHHQLSGSAPQALPSIQPYPITWTDQPTFQHSASFQPAASHYQYNHVQPMPTGILGNQAYANGDGVLRNSTYWHHVAASNLGIEHAQAQEQYARQIARHAQGIIDTPSSQWQSTGPLSTSQAGIRQIEPDSTSASSFFVSNGQNQIAIPSVLVSPASTLHSSTSVLNNASSNNDRGSSLIPSVNNETQAVASTSYAKTAHETTISPSLDRLLATQEILEQAASLAAESFDITNILNQCNTFRRAGMSQSDIEYFKRRALSLINELKKKRKRRRRG